MVWILIFFWMQVQNIYLQSIPEKANIEFFSAICYCFFLYIFSHILDCLIFICDCQLNYSNKVKAIRFII